MYKLQIFHFGNSISADDFKNPLMYEYINLTQISSISDIKKFYLIISKRYVGDYCTVTMHNGNVFFIFKEEQEKLLKAVLLENK